MPQSQKRVRETSRDCQNHKPQPFPEEDADKTKQAQIVQTYEKHQDQLSLPHARKQNKRNKRKYEKH